MCPSTPIMGGGINHVIIASLSDGGPRIYPSVPICVAKAVNSFKQLPTLPQKKMWQAKSGLHLLMNTGVRSHDDKHTI